MILNMFPLVLIANSPTNTFPHLHGGGAIQDAAYIIRVLIQMILLVNNLHKLGGTADDY